MMKKLLTIGLAASVLGAASLGATAPAQARWRGAVAAGVLGGLAFGAVAGSAAASPSAMAMAMATATPPPPCAAGPRLRFATLPVRPPTTLTGTLLGIAAFAFAIGFAGARKRVSLEGLERNNGRSFTIKGDAPSRCRAGGLLRRCPAGRRTAGSRKISFRPLTIGHKSIQVAKAFGADDEDCIFVTRHVPRPDGNLHSSQKLICQD